MFELVPSVLAFALAMTITPGPNNVMVMASGLNFGYRRTVPHMLGISVGFPVMLIAVGAGLGAIIQGHPDVHRTLSYVGAAYLLWLSWKIATAAAAEAGAATGRPIGFFQAAGFQWVNPKAWIIALGAVATFTSADGNIVTDVAIIVIIFAAVVYPSFRYGRCSGEFLAARFTAHGYASYSTLASRFCWSARSPGHWYCRHPSSLSD